MRDIYYFGTCLVDLFYPQAGMAGIQLLERFGARVHYPQEQSCCGQPPFNSGFRDEAQNVAIQQLALFDQPFDLVVPSGSCAGMIKHHWPELLKDTEHEARAIELAARTYELGEYLIDHLNVTLEDQGEPTTVVVHTSCSARREMGVAEQGKALLGMLKNVTVEVPQYETECCGFGGTFSVKQPEISAAMAEDKTTHLAAVGADRFVCGDSGCLMNLSGTLEKRGIQLDSSHLYDFIWERVQ